MDVLVDLRQAGAILLDRHFVYKSGKHGPHYINPDLIFPNVNRLSRICRMLVEPFEDRIDTVAAPATGGIVIAALSALSLCHRGHDAVAVWADKNGDSLAFERAGFIAQLHDKRVLVVEDLLTTGSSVDRVCREAERHGAHIVGVSAICNRGGVTAAQLGVPRLEALADVSFQAFDSKECELCASSVPIVLDIGHGNKYKTRHPEYPGGYVTLLK